MPTIKIHFNDRETLPESLELRAKELDITVEQLIKRFIAEGMNAIEAAGHPAIPGESLDDFLVKNGVLHEKNRPCAQKRKK